MMVHRTYELRSGRWIEVDERPQPPSRWRSLGAILAGAVAIAAMAAIGIVAAAITVLVLPVALLVAWRLSATPHRQRGLSAP